jgi:putative transposase
MKKRYPSDLSDAVRAKLAPLLPEQRTDRPREHGPRELLDAIWYVLRGGISWRALPHDFPAWQTVYSYFRMLKQRNVREALNDALREQVRQQVGREAEPSLLIGDSQSVKTTEKGDPVASTAANG